MDSNRRQYSRSKVQITVEFVSSRGETLTGTTDDVSMNGLFIACEKRLPVHARCGVILEVESPEGLKVIDLEARVARVTDNGMAVEITAVLGASSYQHLRALVLNYAQDRQRAEGEMNNAII